MIKPLLVNNLSKKFGKITAVDSISFEVRNKEIFALIGPNGAGKSTTLRIIATVLQPTNGSASIYGKDIKKDSDKIRKIISYLPEEAGAYKNMKGLSYLKFMASIYGKDKSTQERYIARAKEIANLGKRINDKISTYSKGMIRKLLLAKAIMTKPKLAILDEPTSGLDVSNALFIREQIKKMTKEGMAVLLSSHNMLEIEYLSDRVGIIDKGKIIETGTPRNLKEKYNSKNLEEVFKKITKPK